MEMKLNLVLNFVRDVMLLDAFSVKTAWDLLMENASLVSGNLVGNAREIAECALIGNARCARMGSSLHLTLFVLVKDALRDAWLLELMDFALSVHRGLNSSSNISWKDAVYPFVLMTNAQLSLGLEPASLVSMDTTR
jgi:hypothetical protein